jgi:hypothetical protein
LDSIYAASLDWNFDGKKNGSMEDWIHAFRESGRIDEQTEMCGEH